MMGKISSDAVGFSTEDSSDAERESHNDISSNFNNLLDTYLSDSQLSDSKSGDNKLTEAEGVETSAVADSTLPISFTDGEKMANILLRAIIFGAAQFKDNLNEKGQQKIKVILGEISKEEIEFAKHTLSKASATSITSEELPTILPTMEEIDEFLEESMLSKAS